jgi:acyl-coenzyme A synthetase/AMP-(fatty) acid ligase
MTGMQLDTVGTKSGSCSLPLPGYDVRVLDAETQYEEVLLTMFKCWRCSSF